MEFPHPTTASPPTCSVAHRHLLTCFHVTHLTEPLSSAGLGFVDFSDLFCILDGNGGTEMILGALLPISGAL